MEQIDGSLSLEELKILCAEGMDVLHSTELVNCIEHEDCLYHPGAPGENSHLTKLYSFRFSIAKNYNNPEDLSDFENVVQKMKESKAPYFVIASIRALNSGFMIFYETTPYKLLAIMKSEHKKPIEENEAYYDELLSRKNGISVGVRKYSKGKFVKEWK